MGEKSLRRNSNRSSSLCKQQMNRVFQVIQPIQTIMLRLMFRLQLLQILVLDVHQLFWAPQSTQVLRVPVHRWLPETFFRSFLMIRHVSHQDPTIQCQRLPFEVGLLQSRIYSRHLSDLLQRPHCRQTSFMPIYFLENKPIPPGPSLTHFGGAKDEAMHAVGE
jgi:hypothetical protein